MDKVRNKRKITAAIAAAVLAVAILAITSLALFTDREAANITAKAGVVDITLSPLNLSNKDNINPGDYDPVNWNQSTLYNPGTPHDLTFTVTNAGNKSVRIRNSIIIAVKNTANALLDPRLFKLYTGTPPTTSNLIPAANTYLILDNNPTPILASTYTTGTITAVKYVLPDTKILSGTGTAPEVVSGNTETNASFTYYLSLDRGATNAYMGANLQIDVLTEAIQYQNTTTGTNAQADWTLMSKRTWITSGGVNMDGVVPNATDIAS